ncbi:MAG: MBL fold metallo-hydrolase [Candidatus Thorarchaeota archaeon]
MKIGELEITPVAAESMGVRSLCTQVKTPDIAILLDPSAALSYRKPHEPHPCEYNALDDALDRIRHFSDASDSIFVSHYHFDHVRSGLEDWHYKFSTREDLLRIFSGKQIWAKDNRENINPSQRRRAFYFEKDLKGKSQIEWVDGKAISQGDTTISFSHPVPHGPEDSRLGYVLIVTIEYDDRRFVYAPDVQGPVSRRTLSYLLGLNAELMIVGGPPLYLKKFSPQEIQDALYSLTTLATSTEKLVIDHHLLRSNEWIDWITPIQNAAKRAGHEIANMAELAGVTPRYLEAERANLYQDEPPNEEFLSWLSGTDTFKQRNKPPI